MDRFALPDMGSAFIPEGALPAHPLSRRAVMSVLACFVLLPTTSGCAGVAAAESAPEVAAVISAFARAIGMAALTNRTTALINKLESQVMQWYRDTNQEPPTAITFPSEVYEGGGAISTTIAVKSGEKAIRPEPALFAANGEFLNLLPRAVQAIALIKPNLIQLGIKPQEVHQYLLPKTGQLNKITARDVSYASARGRVEVSYDERSNTETVVVIGLPGGRSAARSFSVAGRFLTTDSE